MLDSGELGDWMGRMKRDCRAPMTLTEYSPGSEDSPSECIFSQYEWKETPSMLMPYGPNGWRYVWPRRVQSRNSMASLNVAYVLRTKSYSSRSSMRLKMRICGMVDSPTPIVPISSDSTSTISE